jgi:manganese/zinc/iron transport system permease protein
MAYRDYGLVRVGHWITLGLLAVIFFGAALAVGGTAFTDVLLLRAYNTRLVVLSTTLMGIGSGVVGVFLLLRKRSLMGDALSHATLPGVALAFLALVVLGQSGKELPWLLVGAGVGGLLGVAAVIWMRRLPRIREDTAMGVVLSVFYGAGVALLGLIQDMPGGSAAGLESFIYGKTASLVMTDFLLISVICVSVIFLVLLFYKELTVLCFDEAFASTTGLPTNRLDYLLLGLACAVTVAGLQAVGLILIIAFLVIPAAAARMWSSRLPYLLAGSALIGGASGWIGSSLSALFPRLPAGAVIVLVASLIFILSLVLGTDRGLLLRFLRQLSLKRRIERQHLLRAVYEIREAGDGRDAGGSPLVAWPELLRKRSWSPRQLRRIVRRAAAADLVEAIRPEGILLSPEGLAAAARVTRNHRLWELFLIEHADIAPNHVDRDADSVEHVLGEALTRQLEQSLPRNLRDPYPEMPRSPHAL